MSAGIAELPVMRVVGAALPWLFGSFAMLVLVTYVTWLSLVLPRWFG